MNKNKKDNKISLLLAAIILFVAFPVFSGVIIFVLLAFFVSVKKPHNKSVDKYSPNKKTDYSGMSKTMTPDANHVHSYNNSSTDYCGTNPNLLRQDVNNNHEHGYDKTMTDYCGANRDMVRGGSNYQMFGDYINRKTDYSGVNPNLLKKK